METKHTPGPWIVQGHPETGWEVEVKDAEGNSIASCDGTLDAAESNACLIAAAPELLALCQEALGLSTMTSGEFAAADLGDFQGRLIRLIARAEGRGE